ncbi:DUF2634 domain-containing protein [Cohnella nanjingensis]|uniref:DUF2634 domain-containing protein n=1 Tax=Cohnella nanjingensis TaxID=1387779 RepID=UPI0028B09304|nr:DUF2634 domain-containing protein [Cohnella nanjingensis]
MANLFPEEEAKVEDAEQSAANEVPFGRSWRFDYDTGDFLMTPTGEVAPAQESEAWLEWCKKAIRTERYKYLVYSHSHGQEFEDLIGHGLSRPAIESEIIRITTETLLEDPRTASVDSFTFNWEDDSCFFNCSISNVRGDGSTLTGSVVTT